MPKGIKYSKKRKLATASRDKTQTPTDKRIPVGRPSGQWKLDYGMTRKTTLGRKRKVFLRPEDELEKKIRKAPAGSRWRKKQGEFSAPPYLKGVVANLDSAYAARKRAKKWKIEQAWEENQESSWYAKQKPISLRSPRGFPKKEVKRLSAKSDSLQVEAWRKAMKASPGIMREFGKKPPLIKKYKKKRPK
jgi:hypothetical protein